MIFRNAMLVLGALLVFAGLGLSLIWMKRSAPVETAQGPQAQAPQPRPGAVLEAAHALPAGILLRADDLRWREMGAGEVPPGAILRKDASVAEFLGAITRKDFAGGEALRAADLLKPADRRFLSAVLSPGTRAVSIAVDAPQSSSGLVLPGDRVDVILIQNFGNAGGDPAHKTVAETVLKNVRVIAVDQRLDMQSNPPATEAAAKEQKMPKTVTLELDESQAERLFVAAQLGGLQLSVRALLADDRTQDLEERSTWAGEVSPALRDVAPTPRALPTGSTIEGLVRRPPAKAY